MPGLKRTEGVVGAESGPPAVTGHHPPASRIHRGRAARAILGLMGFSGRLSAAVFVAAALSLGLPAFAETVDEPLPFLADEVSFPPGVVPRLVWPERLDVRGDGPPNSDERPAELRPQAPAFPDVTALLAAYPGAVADRDDVADARGSIDVVRLTPGHAHQVDVQRLLGAVRAGFARDTRVEVTVTRKGERLLHLDRSVRMGALLFDDDRTDETWPAGVDAGSLLVTPQPMVVRTGARVGLTVEPFGGTRLVVDLDLQISWSSGERAFEDAALRRVAPVVEMIHLRAAVPVVSGNETEMTLGDVRVVIRATRDAPEAPPGTRVLPLPGCAHRLSDAVRVRPRRLPLVWDDDDATWMPAEGPPRAPATWSSAARRAGVRLVAVPPGIAVADGSPAAILRFDALLAPLRDATAYVVRDAALGFSLSSVEGRPFTLCVGRIVPIATDVDVHIRTARAVAVPRIDFEAAGLFVHGAWDDGHLALTLDERTVRDAEPRRVTPRAEEGGGAPTSVTLDAAEITEHYRSARVRGVAGEDAAVSLKRLEEWR